MIDIQYIHDELVAAVSCFYEAINSNSDLLHLEFILYYSPRYNAQTILYYYIRLIYAMYEEIVDTNL